MAGVGHVTPMATTTMPNAQNTQQHHGRVGHGKCLQHDHNIVGGNNA